MRRKARTRKPNRQKTKLGLPDLEHVKSTVLVSLPSPESQRSYRRSTDDFVCWYCSEPRLSFNKAVVTRYRIHLEDKLLAAGTISVRLAAVRRFAYEAADTGILSPDLAAGISRVKGAKKLGMRLGNWLTVDEARSLWQLPNMQWAIVDLVGKGGHIRTVPMPEWVKQTIDGWLKVAEITQGKIFRCVCRTGVGLGNEDYGESGPAHCEGIRGRLGISKLAPQDLRRSCARFCHDSGGELEQIQFLLGHVSVQTTEKYLGCKQRFRHARTLQKNPLNL